MALFRIAFRNLKRAPARTALSIIAVAAAVFAVVLMKATADGILTTMEDGTIRLTAGHVRIIDREYEARERLLSLQYPVDGFQGDDLELMMVDLKALPQSERVIPRIRFGGLISHSDTTRNVLVIAGEPQTEAHVLRADRYLADGRFVQAGEREAVLGRRLMNRFDMDVGDRFTLVFSSAFGALRGYTFEIVGAFESGLPYLDDDSVFIPLDVAQGAVELEGAVTEILLMTDDTRRADALLDSVEAILASRDFEQRYLAVPWYKHSEMAQLLQVARGIYNIIYYIVLSLSGFVIINTFLMIVHERRREIGMLSALGLRPGRIRLLFLLEGGLCGLFGSVIGIALGTPILVLLSRTGISFPGVETIDASLMYPTTLYPVLDPAVVAFAFLGGIVVTLAAAYFPARHAANIRPTDALRT